MALLLQEADKCMLPLKEAQLQEASQMLTDIQAVRSKQFGEHHTSVGETACVLSLLYLCLKDIASASQSFCIAESLLSQQESSSKLTDLMSTVQIGLKQTTAGS